MTTDRKGDWMSTFTGVQFYPLDPRPEEINIRDIAHHLSMLCRWNGATSVFYSVAEHCVALSYVVPANLALQALLHDAAEAYTGDRIRPSKTDADREMEALIAGTIAFKFALPWPFHELVDEYDNRIINDERTALIGHDALPWKDYGDHLGVVIRGLAAPDAEREYLERFRELHARQRPIERPAPVITERDGSERAADWNDNDQVMVGRLAAKLAPEKPA